MIQNWSKSRIKSRSKKKTLRASRLKCYQLFYLGSREYCMGDESASTPPRGVCNDCRTEKGIVQRERSEDISARLCFRHRWRPARALLKRNGMAGVSYGRRCGPVSGDQTERMEAMKHLKSVSKTPHRAQDVTVGSILTVIGKLLTVVATFLTTKEASTAA